MILPGIEVRLTGWSARVLLFTLFKNACDVSLFSSHWELCLTAMTFPIWWSGLATTSAKSHVVI